MGAERPLVNAGRRGIAAALERGSRTVRLLRTRIPLLHDADGQGAPCPAAPKLYMGTAALSERGLLCMRRSSGQTSSSRSAHDTVEKARPSSWDLAVRRFIHVGYQPAHVEQVYFSADGGDRRSGTFAQAACRPGVEGKIAKRASAPGPLREGILKPHRRARHRAAPHPAAPRARRPRGDAAGRHPRPRQTACTRSGLRGKLPHPGRETRFLLDNAASPPWARACRQGSWSALLYPGRASWPSAATAAS